MTGSTAPGTPDRPWPDASHQELLGGLSRHLDQDAGLRDITLRADQAALVGGLGRYLDVQAGLAAILPPPAPVPRSAPGRPGIAALIAVADPAARMALRRNPVTLAAVLSDLIVQALTIAGKVGDRDIYRDYSFSHRALALDRALVLALDRARACGLDFGRVRDLDRVLAVARDLDRALCRVRDLDRALALARVRALGLARAQAVDFTRACSFDLARALALELARALAPDPSLARELGLARDLADDLGLARARVLARRTAQLVGDALGVRQVEGLAVALLEGALDDFIHADLASADLTGRDLTGIRWSDWGTIWPPGTDTDELRRLSQEIAPGVYEITPPGHGDKARHNTLT